jgi:hypothetical protein
MSSLQISVGEHEREVKCFHRVFEVLFSTESDAFGGIACEGGLNADRLSTMKVSMSLSWETNQLYLTISASRSAWSQSCFRAMTNERLA